MCRQFDLGRSAQAHISRLDSMTMDVRHHLNPAMNHDFKCRHFGKRHAIDPQRYLTQLLVNLPETPMSQIDEWLPDEWKLRTPSPSG